MNNCEKIKQMSLDEMAKFFTFWDEDTEFYIGINSKYRCLCDVFAANRQWLESEAE